MSADGVQVREAVLELRRSKGMVLDEHDPDTWSVGSFFVNPIVSDAVARTLPDECPRFPTPSGEVKVSAAWLIAASGIDRGFQLPESSARVSTKHTLAISNAGSATCEDVIELARWDAVTRCGHVRCRTRHRAPAGRMLPVARAFC